MSKSSVSDRRPRSVSNVPVFFVDAWVVQQFSRRSHPAAPAGAIDARGRGEAVESRYE
jgi:hypothetical protein